MDAAEARRRVEIEAQWTVSPGLTADEVAYCVERGRVADASGRWPGEAGYADTWTDASVRWAVGLAWAIKAGKATPKFRGKAGSVEGDRQQVFDMCMRMARSCGYRGAAGGGAVGSLSLAASRSGVG